MALTFVDLFAGCGGLSLGLLQSGMTGICAVEKAAPAFLTLKANLVEGAHSPHKFSWPAWLPQRAMGVEEFVEKYLQRMCSELDIDVIAGGPPCQGFSTGGKRDANDPRNFLFEKYLAVVAATRPRYLVLENVAGIAKPFSSNPLKVRRGSVAKDAVFSQIIKEALEKLGYVITERLYDASMYGVPQYRMRYIMMGYREDVWEAADLSAVRLNAMAKEVRTEHLAKFGLKARGRVSASQAISDLEVEFNGTQPCSDTKGFTEVRYRGPRTAFQRLMRIGMGRTPPNSLRLPQHRPLTIRQFQKIMEICEPGKNLTAASRKKLGIKKNRTCLLAHDLPGRTVTTLPDDFVHYREPRTLTVRESARLQSFPDWFEFHGPYTTGGAGRKNSCPRYTQVGNAVPVLFAAFLGALIASVDAETLRAKRARSRQVA